MGLQESQLDHPAGQCAPCYLYIWKGNWASPTAQRGKLTGKLSQYSG